MHSLNGARVPPLVTYGVMAGILGILWAMAVTADLASQLYLSLLVAVLAGGAYLVRRRKQS